MTFLLPIAVTAAVIGVCVQSARKGPRLATIVILGVGVIAYSWASWVVSR